MLAFYLVTAARVVNKTRTGLAGTSLARGPCQCRHGGSALTRRRRKIRIRSAEASQSGPAFGGDGAGRGAAPAMAPAQGTASANVGQAL